MLATNPRRPAMPRPTVIQVHASLVGEKKLAVVKCRSYEDCVTALAQIIQVDRVSGFVASAKFRGYPEPSVLARYQRGADGKFRLVSGSAENVNLVVSAMPHAQPQAAPAAPRVRVAAPEPPRRARRRTPPPAAPPPASEAKLYYVRIETSRGTRMLGARTPDQAENLLAAEVSSSAYDFSTSHVYTLIEEDPSTGAQRVIRRVVG